MPETSHNVNLEVRRDDVGTTRLVRSPLPPLGPGSVRLRIDRFALTANNVTYAVAGDMLGYWDFFPATDGWGRVPAMGWADVVESTHPEIPTGFRYYGWYPMSAYVDLVAGPTTDGFRDDGAHRHAHAPVYRAYVETSRDPWYDASTDGEDRHALLRGLFLTGFLIDEYFADREYVGAEQVIVLSASSKTAIGFAQRAAKRDGLHLVGVTSARNADFVATLGWYDQVITYGDLDALDTTRSSVVVDMAGDTAVLATLHERLGDRVLHSMTVGMSHHDAPQVPIAHGPRPELFFAPAEVQHRIATWGHAEYADRTATALREFVTGSTAWLHPRRVTGPDQAVAAYAEVFDGRVPPDVGLIVSLHDQEPRVVTPRRAQTT